MKRCTIVVNTGKHESNRLGNEIHSFLRCRGIESSFLAFDGYSCDYPFEGSDFVLTLGGDGTVLYAARGCAPLGIPVFPVNLGEFGFIASIQKESWEKELSLFIAGGSRIEQRSMIHAELIHEGKTAYAAAGLNDVVLSAKNALHTISFEVAFNHATLGKFKADGIIIATPTGSTAYSVSAGGPIVDPGMEALVLTPINSFSLSSRPLVLSLDGELCITLLESRIPDAKITIDGQKSVNLVVGDCIIVKRAPYKAQLIGCSSGKFYEALRSKLNWSGGPHA
ncbi:MAG: NAD(+)/NADH kinase [Treponema sp.]|jgi:NAD+ kinase|nr:NAD(+)/NADH kinase [Treponema sp.]